MLIIDAYLFLRKVLHYYLKTKKKKEKTKTSGVKIGKVARKNPTIQLFMLSSAFEYL